MQEQEPITVFLIKQKPIAPNGLGQKYTVLIPPGYSLAFLRRFVYSGCKAIGEREELNLALECKARVFPYDYPFSQAGKETFKLNAL